MVRNEWIRLAIADLDIASVQGGKPSSPRGPSAWTTAIGHQSTRMRVGLDWKGNHSTSRTEVVGGERRHLDTESRSSRVGA